MSAADLMLFRLFSRLEVCVSGPSIRSWLDTGVTIP